MKYKLPEIKITVSYKKPKNQEPFTITCSRDVAEFCRSCFDADTIAWREEMIMICLNRVNEVCGFYKVSSGGFGGTICDPKVVFTVALNCCASSIILSHNHPSGNLKPSQADIDLTKKFVSAGKVLDITILDHVIVSADSYSSFRDEGLM